MREPNIAVLIPCYNEEQTIAQVIGDFSCQLPQAQIYVYDNNSSDRTAELAKAQGAIVRFVGKQGKGHVVRQMFSEIEADYYIMVDGDDTYGAADVHSLLAPALSGNADMVVGNRLENSVYDKTQTRPFHSFGNRLVSFLVSRIFSHLIRDTMTGYRVFTRYCVRSLSVSSGGFDVETEITCQCLNRRMRIVEVPISYQDRPEGSASKLRTFRDGSRVILMIFNLFRSYRPLPFFGLISIFLFGMSLILGLPLVVEFAQTGLVPRFPTAILAMGLATISVVSFGTGLLLDTIVTHQLQNTHIYLQYLKGSINRETGEKASPSQKSTGL